MANFGKAGRSVGGGQASRVLRTGLALVHEGELIFPAVGSEAQVERVAEDSQSVIHYHFPIEIEVKAAPDPIDPASIVDAALSQLAKAMRSV